MTVSELNSLKTSYTVYCSSGKKTPATHLVFLKRFQQFLYNYQTSHIEEYNNLIKWLEIKEIYDIDELIKQIEKEVP